jgi:hypothetical protein
MPGYTGILITVCSSKRKALAYDWSLFPNKFKASFLQSLFDLEAVGLNSLRIDYLPVLRCFKPDAHIF